MLGCPGFAKVLPEKPDYSGHREASRLSRAVDEGPRQAKQLKALTLPENGEALLGVSFMLTLRESGFIVITMTG